MILVMLFAGFQLLATGYALLRGGAPERHVGIMLLVAAIADWMIPAGPHAFHSVFWPVLWVDLVLLAGLTTVALFADRFWPGWIAACQLLTVAGHGIRAYQPSLWALAYWFITESMAYPMLMLLVVGVLRHHRRVALRPEFAWTIQRLRHDRGSRTRPPSTA